MRYTSSYIDFSYPNYSRIRIASGTKVFGLSRLYCSLIWLHARHMRTCTCTTMHYNTVSNCCRQSTLYVYIHCTVISLSLCVCVCVLCTCIAGQLLQLHRGQGKDIYWRDCYICPTEEEYMEMVRQSKSSLSGWYVHVPYQLTRDFFITVVVCLILVYTHVRGGVS